MLGVTPRVLDDPVGKFVKPFENWEKWLSPETFQNGIPIILDEPGYFLACSIFEISEKTLGNFEI